MLAFHILKVELLLILLLVGLAGASEAQMPAVRSGNVDLYIERPSSQPVFPLPSAGSSTLYGTVVPNDQGFVFPKLKPEMTMPLPDAPLPLRVPDGPKSMPIPMPDAPQPLSPIESDSTTSSPLSPKIEQIVIGTDCKPVPAWCALVSNNDPTLFPSCACRKN